MQRRGFDDLPTELIQEVFEYVDLSRPKYAMPNGAEDVFYVLARLNRRTKPIALAFAWRHRKFESYDDFAEMERQMDEWACHHSFEELDQCDNFLVTKSITIGHVPYPYGCTTFDKKYNKLRFRLDWFRWSNLESFECLDAVFNPGWNIQALYDCQKLRNVVILWPCDLVFPDLDDFPNVETLRLYLADRNKNHSPRPPAPIGTYSSLHTLAMHELYDFQAIERCCRGLNFPHLRVLKLTEIESPARTVYDFIQRHSTLLEVNLTFAIDHVSPLRLEAVLKLIDGTGTWVRPEGDGAPVDQPDYNDMIGAPTPLPPRIAHMYGIFPAFAFVRRPLSPQALEWRSYHGSPHPRYKCTAFAVNWTWQADATAKTSFRTNYTLTDAIEFVQSPPQAEGKFWDEVQQLRLSSELFEDRQTSYQDIMRLIAGQLNTSFPQLRRLALFWPHPKCSWRPLQPDASSAQENFFLDKAFPPAFHQLMIKPKSLTMQELVFPPEDFAPAPVAAAVREVLGIPEHVVLDKNDRGLLLTAWETKNRVVAEEGIRLLAASHRVLEEVEWYSGQDAAQYGVIRWVWKITRHPDGAVKDVVGDLSWTEDGKGNPPPLLTLVGQELDYTLQDAAGCWHRAWPYPRDHPRYRDMDEDELEDAFFYGEAELEEEEEENEGDEDME